MVPPTFLEIFYHISQRILNQFVTDRSEDNDLGVSNHHGLSEPPKKMGAGEYIVECVIQVILRELAILAIRGLLVVSKVQARVDVG
jgi:hypothetical protein